MESLLCSKAGSEFTTTFENVDHDVVNVKYTLNTEGTEFDFVKFTAIKQICNRRDNCRINATEIEFSFDDCENNKQYLRSWLLFIRYLQSTFGFAVTHCYKNKNKIQLKLAVHSNRTCVDDIIRAYANVKLEEPSIKDKYLLTEISKIRMLGQFQKV